MTIADQQMQFAEPAATPPPPPPPTRSGDGYDADAIQTLEGLDAVRKRPGMYIGGTDSDGLMHLLWELVDNGVDEAAAGHARNVDVIFHDDRSAEVRDDGRGIPLGRPPGRDITAIEVVFSELHAGGKFGGTSSNSAYGASGGLHGVGASVVNALSERLSVVVGREGNAWQMDFSGRRAGRYHRNGKFEPTHDLRKVRRTASTFTHVRFWPDWDIFSDGASYDHAATCERLRLMCHLVPGLRVTVTDHRTSTPEEPFEFRSEKGLAGLVTEAAGDAAITRIVDVAGTGTFEEKTPVDGKLVTVERKCDVFAALQWTSEYRTDVRTFVNTIPTPAGGTHLAGFDRAVTRAINETLLDGSKHASNVSRDEAQEGLVAAVQVVLPEPQFRGQTKQQLGTPAVQSIVYQAVKASLTEWIATGGPRRNVASLRAKIVAAAKAKAASRQLLADRRKASSMHTNGLPTKLADCRSHGPDSELVIVEGESAAGPAKAGRNSESVAILPLRGKVVNAAKASLKQVLDNAEAQALFRSVGAGIGVDFDPSAARYGRIVILCDADVDGSHIRCLLLTLMHEYMRPMLEAGRVYAAQPPLYTTRVANKTYRAFSDSERDALTERLNAKRRGDTEIRWQRFKGLGEMNTDELAHCALDPATRTLRRITIDDAAQARQMLDVLMGSDVAQRRDYLTTHSSVIDPSALDF